MRKRISVILAIVLVAGLSLWDHFGACRVSRTWPQPDDVRYEFLRPDGAQKLRLRVTVSGRQSPIRFFDMDNEFLLEVTYGSYFYARTIDLIDGQDDYTAYVQKCSVRWGTNAISFIEPSGLEIKMPIEMLKNRL